MRLSTQRGMRSRYSRVIRRLGVGLVTHRFVRAIRRRPFKPCKDALRLNPYAHGWYRLLIARAFDMLGDAEKALHESQDIASDIPFGAYLNIACLQARMGRPAEAKTALAEALRLNPQFTLSAVERYLNCRDGDYVETVKDGLRKAGLPE